MDASIFQSKEWEEFKLATGYQKSHQVSDVLILQKKLPVGRTMLYSPMVSKAQVESIKLSSYQDEITKIAKDNKSIFYRLELNIPQTTNYKLPAHNAFGKADAGGPTTNWTKSFEEMQPENNWVLDISKNEEEILAGMKQKGRYNIKIAQDTELSLTTSNLADSKELNAFYNQYQKTGQRHKIAYRSKQYFTTLLEILGGKGYALACTVWHAQKPLASAIFILYGESALYLYGGSSDEERNLMAPYLLHWEMIKYAKNKGFKEYNFLGVAPNNDQNHPWAGITRFKKQFGGEQVDILGCYDLPYKQLEYKAFKIAEKIRRH